MSDIRTELINLLSEYISGVITKEDVIRLRRDIFRYNVDNPYILDDLFVRPFVMSLNDNYDFPSKKHNCAHILNRNQLQTI